MSTPPEPNDSSPSADQARVTSAAAMAQSNAAAADALLAELVARHDAKAINKAFHQRTIRHVDHPVVDQSKLPATLADKYSRRRAAGHDWLDGGGPYRRWIARPGQVVAVTAGIAAVLSLLFFFFGAFLALYGHGNLGLEIAGACFATMLGTGGLAVGIFSAGSRWAPHPLALTRTESDQLHAARVDWPVGHWSKSLEKLPDGDRLREEVRDSTPTEAWCEARAIGLASVLAEAIRTSPAWRSEILDTARIDLDRALADIELRGWRIWRLRANIVAPESDRTAAALQQTTAAATHAADSAWIALVDLIAMLDRYRAELIPIEEKLAGLEALERASTIDLDDDIRQLHIDAAGSELDATALAHRVAELAEVRAGLTAYVAALREELEGPAFALPLERS